MNDTAQLYFGLTILFGVMWFLSVMFLWWRIKIVVRKYENAVATYEKACDDYETAIGTHVDTIGKQKSTINDLVISNNSMRGALHRMTDGFNAQREQLAKLRGGVS